MHIAPRHSTQCLLTTIATSLGFILVQLDVSIVNIALARIGQDLGASVTTLQWIVDGYTLPFAALMLSAGACGDRVGARRVFVLAFGLFVAASFGCGVAPTPAALIAARAVQGIGAAGLVPSSLALLNQACRDDSKARARAVGLWTAAGSVALAVGPVLGGLMIEWFGWRSIFLVNVPLGFAGIWLTLRWVEETQRGEGGLDLVGQALGIITLCAATGAVIEGGALGWRAPLVIVMIISAVAAGVAFLRTEAGNARPLLPLGFFRLPSFTPTIVVGCVLNFTLYGAIFVFNLFLQRLAGYPPVQSGLAFLPFPVVLFAANLTAGMLVATLGPRLPMTVGLATAAVGFAMLSTLKPGMPWIEMLPGLVVIPAGIGIAVPAMTAALLGAVPRPRAGVASGVLNTVRQAGGAIGVALSGNLLASNGVAGIHVSFLLAVGLLCLAALIALVGTRSLQASPTTPLEHSHRPAGSIPAWRES
jgi:MFS transporter, DHA2 family, methylenomycin A resistance protein